MGILESPSAQPTRGFFCNVCNKQFCFKSTLNTHLLTHSRNEVVKSTASLDETFPPPPAQGSFPTSPKRSRKTPSNSTDFDSNKSHRGKTENDSGLTKAKKTRLSKSNERQFSSVQITKSNQKTQTKLVKTPSSLHLPSQPKKHYYCNICCVGIANQSSMERHEASAPHLANLKFKFSFNCEKCDYKTATKSNLKRHELTKHPDKKATEEPKSDDDFEWAKAFPCTVCNVSYEFPFLLRRHQKSFKHQLALSKNGLPPTGIQIVHHLKSNTSNKENESNSVRPIKSRRSSKTHEKSERAKKHTGAALIVSAISNVKKSTKTKNFKKTTEETKTVSTSFSCATCNVSFRVPHLLRRHKDGLRHKQRVALSLKSSKLKKNSIVNKEKFRGGDFHCDICNVSFQFKFILERHRLSQRHQSKSKRKIKETQIKPYSCRICGLSFSLKSNLQRHFARKIHQDNLTKRGNGSVEEKDLAPQKSRAKNFTSGTGSPPVVESDQQNKSIKQEPQSHNEKGYLSSDDKGGFCDICETFFNLRTNFRRHLKSEKHKAQLRLLEIKGGLSEDDGSQSELDQSQADIDMNQSTDRLSQPRSPNKIKRVSDTEYLEKVFLKAKKNRDQRMQERAQREEAREQQQQQDQSHSSLSSTSYSAKSPAKSPADSPRPQLRFFGTCPATLGHERKELWCHPCYRKKKCQGRSHLTLDQLNQLEKEFRDNPRPLHRNSMLFNLEGPPLPRTEGGCQAVLGHGFKNDWCPPCRRHMKCAGRRHLEPHHFADLMRLRAQESKKDWEQKMSEFQEHQLLQEQLRQQQPQFEHSRQNHQQNPKQTVKATKTMTINIVKGLGGGLFQGRKVADPEAEEHIAKVETNVMESTTASVVPVELASEAPIKVEQSVPDFDSEGNNTNGDLNIGDIESLSVNVDNDDSERGVDNNKSQSELVHGGIQTEFEMIDFDDDDDGDDDDDSDDNEEPKDGATQAIEEAGTQANFLPIDIDDVEDYDNNNDK